MNHKPTGSPRTQLFLRVTLYSLFVLSGAAGLIYESLWARYLALFVGHAAYAQILVLAIFLGGMAGGALLVSARSRQLRDPLLWYARAELVIGILGLSFHGIYTLVTAGAYERLLPLAGSGILLQLAKWSVASLLILPQSVLLGTTFPLMSAAVLRRLSSVPGRTLSILYFANSFGAAVGVLLAGFWLLALAGLPGTLLVASGINLLVAFGSMAVAGKYPVAQADLAAATVAPPPVERMNETGTQRLLLGVAFGTAVASFIYEIGWIRMLSLVLGSATHSFELMLSAFILGLALGSLWTRKRADTWKEPLRALAVVQWFMGIAALATILLYTTSFGWMASLMSTFARSDAGYIGFSLAKYGISLAIMLPATFCAGVTLPLITRILLLRRLGERAIGQVYGLNTLGSIVGVIAAGLILLPALGLKNLLVVGGTLDMALGALVLIVWAGQRPLARRFAYAVTGATAILGIAALLSHDFDRRLLASSVYREGAIPEPGSLESVFHQDGRTATVSVTRQPSGMLTIATNGKPDASLSDYWLESCSSGQVRRPLGSDAATQVLGPLITAAHAPAARTAAIIGMGSGMSSHFALGLTALERLVTVEIEPVMVEGARAFYPANRRVFDDPRSSIVYDDAKSYFAASGDRFDFIFSEPSNPWVSGVASLFSTEFYERIGRYLTESGVFGQWLHLYEIDDGLVLSVLAAIHHQFPSYAIYQTWNADILIVASNAPRLPEPDWTVFDNAGVREGLCHVFPLTPRMLGATRLLDRRVLAPLLDDWGHPNSDFYPILDLGAERTRYLRQSARGLVELSAARFDLTGPFVGRSTTPTDEVIAPVPRIPRIQAAALAAGLRNPELVNALVEEERNSQLPGAQYLLDTWRAALTLGEAPADWTLWVRDFAAAERVVHGDMAGFADPDFYGSTEGFLELVDAPGSVRDVVAFRHGLASWDFQLVSRTGERLLQGVLGREGVIPPDDYLDGMVVAKLRLGDMRSARQIFNQVVPLSSRAPTDLRLRLLDAYIDALSGVVPTDLTRP
jgi:spermidine synthase